MGFKETRKIVLVGGGHTHALVLHALKGKPLERAEITVINPGKTAPYSGMLPGFLAGHYTRDDLDINLERLTAEIGAQLVIDRAVGLDSNRRLILLEGGETLDFDIASIDVGITSNMASLPGFAEFGVPAKPLAEFAVRWDAFRRTKGPKNVVILGGGIAGAEIAMAISYALRDNPEPVSIKLLDRSKILSRNSSTAQKRVRKELAEHSVEVFEDVEVVEVNQSGLVLGNSDHVSAEFIVGAAGATPHRWIWETDLSLSEGFINVDETLQTSVPDVFAVGDCAAMTHDPRPKAGVFAVRQAPVLTANLRNLLSGEPLQAFKPQADYLKLVSLGDKRAFGEKMGWGFSGHLVWRLKDKIDRDFMNQF